MYHEKSFFRAFAVQEYLAMKLIIHADDFGFSKGVSDKILECADKGSLTSTSIVPNGYAFDYAIKEFKKRKGLRLGIHLNLAEGKALRANKGLLVDEKGYFKHSFQSLWFAWLSAGKAGKKRLKHETKKEIASQVEKVRKVLPKNAKINIDSHRHFHMIPFVFETILELRKELGISYIRIPKEPFFLALDRANFLENYFGLNIAKHVLLNQLSAGKKQKLEKLGIKSNDYFIGNIFAGNMSEEVVRAALPKIWERNAVVEALFHPGFAKKEEAVHWKDGKGFPEFYYSEWRKKEFKTVKSVSFKRLVEDFGGVKK